MTDLSHSPSLAEAGPAQAVDLRATPNFDLLAAVPLRLSVEVGSASLPLADLLALGEGAVIELDRATGDLLDIFANGTLVARGEVVGVGDRYGIKIIEVVAAEHRLDGLERRK